MTALDRWLTGGAAYPIESAERAAERQTLSDVFPILTGNKPSAPNEYAGTFPRKRHSHRCPVCTNAVACYRAQCRKPQRITREQCQWHR